MESTPSIPFRDLSKNHNSVLVAKAKGKSVVSSSFANSSGRPWPADLGILKCLSSKNYFHVCILVAYWISLLTARPSCAVRALFVWKSSESPLNETKHSVDTYLNIPSCLMHLWAYLAKMH